MPKLDQVITSETKQQKVAHVKRATQERSHHCHWPGCGKQCAPAMWGCKNCWCKLPSGTRQRIWTTYRIGQEKDGKPSLEYIAAARAAQEWIRANYPIQE